MKIEAMLWVVFLLSVALAFLFPKTRAFSISAISVAIIAIVGAILVANHGEQLFPGAAIPPVLEKERIDFEQDHVAKLDKADPDAKNRIRVEDIRFDQVRAEARAEPGSVGAIIARLYNDSATYALTDFGYYLAVQDCIQSVCTTVFDQRGLSAASVPPNQARDVTIPIRDGNTRDRPPIKILGTAKILLKATSTRAQAASGTESSG
jgi:hypothetical protein